MPVHTGHFPCVEWQLRAEPPKKCVMRGPGRPRKIQHETEVEVIYIDPESDDSELDSDGYTGKRSNTFVLLDE